MAPLLLRLSELEVEPLEIVNRMDMPKRHLSTLTLESSQLDEEVTLMTKSTIPINGAKCCCCPCCCCNDYCCC